MKMLKMHPTPYNLGHVNSYPPSQYLVNSGGGAQSRAVPSKGESKGVAARDFRSLKMAMNYTTVGSCSKPEFGSRCK